MRDLLQTSEMKDIEEMRRGFCINPFILGLVQALQFVLPLGAVSDAYGHDINIVSDEILYIYRPLVRLLESMHASFLKRGVF